MTSVSASRLWRYPVVAVPNLCVVVSPEALSTALGAAEDTVLNEVAYLPEGK
ncbi:MAG: hypothetical protein ACTHZ5_09470 [Micrococcaceae bacterium]